MRHILDTGVFFRPEALRELAEADDDIRVPAVAFAERLRQLAVAQKDTPALERLLDRIHAEVEPFGRLEALRMLPMATRCSESEWSRLARDAMIASHVRPDDVLWTCDPHDFLALGVREDQLRAV